MRWEWLHAPVARACVGLSIGLGLLGVAGTGFAQSVQYEFAAPKDEERDVLWRVDTLSGEMGMCFFEKKSRKNPNGSMTCLRPGSGAGVQDRPGPYGLVPPNREDATGIFRVNGRTGTLSLCYDVDDRKGHRIVCTEPNR